MRLTSTGVLVLSVLVFAVPANAGNGNGNGNAGASESAPGNSANAPGQLKKDAETAPTVTTTAAEASAPVASVGVKPASDTAHDTHAEAQSNETKEYGNGATTGQIAVKNGAAPTTKLHGPGNSQPHKAAPCAGGHEVDVHALKGRRAGACAGGTPDPHPTPDPGPPVHDVTPPVVVTTSGQPNGDPAQTPSAADPAPQPVATGEAPGAVASRAGNGAEEGVLGAAQRVGRAASLPFTGQRLWLAVLVGVLLIATGLVLREIRFAEAAVESGHDHSDRAHQPPRSSRPPVGGRSSR